MTTETSSPNVGENMPTEKRPMADDEDMRGGAPRPPCEHAWSDPWTSRDGTQRISDCALCGDRMRTAVATIPAPVETA